MTAVGILEVHCKWAIAQDIKWGAVKDDLIESVTLLKRPRLIEQF